MKKASIALALTLLIAGCGGGNPTTSSGQGTPKSGGTLRVALESELRTLDPLASSQLVEREVYYQMYESLLSIDERLNVKPQLATKWELTNPTTYTFTLRTGVKFHDGTDFNAEAVKFNINRILAAKSSPRKSELASVDSVDATDATTAVFHLKRPDATLLAQLVDRAGMMLSPKAVRDAGDALTLNPIGAGSGPFAFVEWKRDDHLTLKKNPGYWKPGLPYLDQVIFRALTNDDARVAAVRTGDVDVVRTIPGKDVSTIKADGNLIYRELPELGFRGFELNHAAGPFSDKAKAQAVAAAVDRAQLVKNVFFNIGTVSYGPIPPASWAFDPGEKVFDKVDTNKARTLATGFTFALKTPNTPDNIQQATLIKDQLAKAGITATIQAEEFGQLLNETQGHNFEASLVGWSGRIDPDGNTYSWFHTGGGNNDGQYSNPQVDQLLDQARQTPDQSKRKQFYAEAQKLLVSDAAYVFTNHYVVAQISTNKVHGFVLVPDGMFRFAGASKS